MDWKYVSQVFHAQICNWICTKKKTFNYPYALILPSVQWPAATVCTPNFCYYLQKILIIMLCTCGPYKLELTLRVGAVTNCDYLQRSSIYVSNFEFIKNKVGHECPFIRLSVKLKISHCATSCHLNKIICFIKLRLACVLHVYCSR